MDAAQTVRQLWDRIQERDWEGVHGLLDAGLVVEWPVSGERIVGPGNFVRVNAEYPQGWSIRVLRIVADGDQVVSEVEVPHESLGVFRAASFWTVRDGRITSGREYWTESGADPVPEWRAGFVERM